MYKKMLVPLDGSRVAEVVFDYARELAARLRLDLTLLHVCTPEEYELHPMHRVYIDHAAEQIRRASEKMQNSQPAGEARHGVQARGVLTMGHPAEEILRFADEDDIDIILMATHGHSGMGRWAIGSVADKVLRVTRVPVWLVRAGLPYEIVHDRFPRRAMLVPLDGSPLAEVALPHVEALARQRGADLVQVILLRVCAPSGFPSTSGADVSQECQALAERQLACETLQAQRYLDTTAGRLTEIGLRVKTEVLTGPPAATIIDYAETHPLHLVVMATHGWTGQLWWPWGSVAGRVLESVSSPVFLVRCGTPAREEPRPGTLACVT